MVYIGIRAAIYIFGDNKNACQKKINIKMKCRKAVFLQQQLKGKLKEEWMSIWPECVASFFRWSVTSIGPAEALRLMGWSRWRCWILWSWPHTVSGPLHFIRFDLCLLSLSVFLPLFKQTKSLKSYLNLGPTFNREERSHPWILSQPSPFPPGLVFYQ